MPLGCNSQLYCLYYLDANKKYTRCLPLPYVPVLSHTVPLPCALVLLLQQLQLLLLLASWAQSHSELLFLAVDSVTAMQFGANLIQS